MNIHDALNIVDVFKNQSVKETFKHLEKLDNTIARSNFENIFLAANIIKSASSQIDEIVHASGIMIAKEVWLNKNEEEQIQYLSLGAGNHKERFDMETNLRIAEFKFGKWNEKSANGVRRRGYFSNYVGLLTSDDYRGKYFVMEDKTSFLKFITGKAKWRNVLSKNPSGFKKLENFLIANQKEHLLTVGQIFKQYQQEVTILDYNQVIQNT